MMDVEERLKKIHAELEKIGRKACEIAADAVINEKYECKLLQEAIDYFMREGWGNFHHPALLAIACEAVGGKPEDTTLVGAALVLLTGAADVHDDIMDKSASKGSKATVFGRFGEDISILVGDALLFEGLMLLDRACDAFAKKKAKIIKEIVKKGFFELGAAQAIESTLKGDWSISPEDLLQVIKRKAAVAEATGRAGAVIGNANPRQIEDWAKIGRIMATLFNITDDIVDMFEPEELNNRKDNECLPLPILYAMRETQAREKIIHMFKKGKLTEEDAAELANTALETAEMQKLKAETQNLINELDPIICKYEGCGKAALIVDLVTLAAESLSGCLA